MNTVDIIVAAAAVLIIAGAVFLTVRRKKHGKGCSCGCSDCGLCDKYKNEKRN